MKRYPVLVLILGALGVAAGAFASPAPWYRWSSKLDGKTVCMQTSPGTGWTLSGGPFKDSHCERLERLQKPLKPPAS